MTLPRFIVPGSTYSTGRRCTQRQCFLRPDAKTRTIFEYCLFEAATRFSIQLHAWVMMSNHYHVVFTDPLGRAPDFLQRLNHLLAKSLNVRWGRWENLWASEALCLTRVVEPSDVDDKIVYVLANPVADHLVERTSDWPGSTSWFLLGGQRRRARRPVGFFRENGPMPEEVELEVAPPPHVGDRGAWSERIREAVKRKEEMAREERAKTGRRVLGARASRLASAFSKPATNAPRRHLRPHVACKSAEVRVRELRALRRFRASYAEARVRFAMGDRLVPFPFGTFGMRGLGVLVMPAPS